MSLRVRNRWKYQGDDHWEWTAFLDDEGSGDLAQVDHVEYVLHPTFPKPVVRVKDPDGGFALKRHGWGTFKLIAFAHKKDGTKKRLTHDLDLSYAPQAGTSE